MSVQPNMILINCDDLGYGDLGCYGSTRHRTPALDRMAAEGLRFTDFYMASPVCSPSRGAMMTGCYPKRIGFGAFEGRGVLFPGQGVGLHPNEITLARTLKDAGYATFHIGKWHCGDQPAFLPTRHGFDHYYGIPFSNDMGRQKRLQGFTAYPPLPLLADEEVIQEQPDQASLTERYTEQAVRFIRRHQEGPFFLYLAHLYVHLPLFAPARFAREFPGDNYAAAVACVDWSTGVLLHELKKLGIKENTLVIFTSDNGSRNDNPGSNGPLRGRKGATWEGGQRLPCIMYRPGAIPAGGVCRQMAASLDFLPTLTLLGGGRVPDDRILDGLDIRPLLTDPEHAVSPRNTFFYYWMDNLEAVRRGDWKLHVRKGKEEIRELYNLAEDIGETVNLYDHRPDMVAELGRLLAESREDIGDSAAGISGANCRPCGRVDNPVPLTAYDPDHPYIEAMYDSTAAG